MSPNGQSNKVVFVTGASSGIGRTTAIHFASLGCKMVICGRNETTLKETADACKGAADVLSVTGDLTVETDVQRMVKESMEHYNRCDVLVNNAGTYGFGSIETTTMEQYNKLMDINLKAAYNLTMLLVPYITECKGCIINVSSIAGLVSLPGCLAASVSKAALNHFTKCVAMELAPKQVRVNSINPGVIETPLLREMFGRDEGSEKKYLDFIESCKKSHPLGRVGTPIEVAKCIAFLASEDAGFITGIHLSVDGGRHTAASR